MPHETEPELLAPAAGRKQTRFYCGRCWLQHEDVTICGMCIPIYIYTYTCMTCTIYILHMHDMYYLSTYIQPGGAARVCIYIYIYMYIYLLCNRKNKRDMIGANVHTDPLIEYI